MSQYEVGKPYKPDVTSWPENICEYDVTEDGHDFRVFLQQPRLKDVESIRRRDAAFALFNEGDVLLFMAKFGTLDWMIASFNIGIAPVERAVRPPSHDQPGAESKLTVFLVNSSDGKLCALREFTLSAEFTTAVHKAIRRRIDNATNWDTLTVKSVIFIGRAQEKSLSRWPQ